MAKYRPRDIFDALDFLSANGFHAQARELALILADEVSPELLTLTYKNGWADGERAHAIRVKEGLPDEF